MHLLEMPGIQVHLVLLLFEVASAEKQVRQVVQPLRVFLLCRMKTFQLRLVVWPLRAAAVYSKSISS